MICANCGYVNMPDAQFCMNCGAVITGFPESLKTLNGDVDIELIQNGEDSWNGNFGAPPEPDIYFDPYEGPDLQENGYCETGKENKKQRKDKKQKGKRAVWSGVIAAVIITAGLAGFFLFAAAPVEGWWYNEETSTAVKFGQSAASVYSLSGVEMAEYRYERLTGKGSVLFGQETPFSIDKDALVYGSGINLTRVGESFNTEAFITSALYGRWSNKERAEVVEMNEDGTALLYTAKGNSGGMHSFDVETGDGVLTLGGIEHSFTASVQSIDITGCGTYIKEGESFNIGEFIEEYGNPLKGAWYDKAGNIGRLDFLDGGVLKVLSYGAILDGSYVFDNKKDTGNFTAGGKKFDIRIESGSLAIGEWRFTRDYTAQKTAADAFQPLKGIWYDAAGESGTLEFFPDGSVKITSKGAAVETNCTFTPITGGGTIEAAAGQAARDFGLDKGKLTLGKIIYKREYTEQIDSAVAGTWYHTEGRMGVLKILNGGKAELELMGSKYTGTYAFDTSSATGTISTTYNNRPWTFTMRFERGKLVVETGLFIAGDVSYTHDVVKQTAP